MSVVNNSINRGFLSSSHLAPPPTDRPGRAIEGPSATYLRGQEGSLADAFYKRRVLGWVQYYFVLCPVKKVLYQFQTELVCKYGPTHTHTHTHIHTHTHTHTHTHIHTHTHTLMLMCTWNNMAGLQDYMYMYSQIINSAS